MEELSPGAGIWVEVVVAKVRAGVGIHGIECDLSYPEKDKRLSKPLRA